MTETAYGRRYQQTHARHAEARATTASRARLWSPLVVAHIARPTAELQRIAAETDNPLLREAIARILQLRGVE